MAEEEGEALGGNQLIAWSQQGNDGSVDVGLRLTTASLGCSPSSISYSCSK